MIEIVSDPKIQVQIRDWRTQTTGVLKTSRSDNGSGGDFDLQIFTRTSRVSTYGFDIKGEAEIVGGEELDGIEQPA